MPRVPQSCWQGVEMTTTQPNPVSRSLVWIAWAVMLLVSLLPTVLLQEVIGRPAGWLIWAKFGVMAALAVASFLWAPLRPLRAYALILLVVFGAEELSTRLEHTSLWRGWFGGVAASFTREMLGIQVRRVAVALVVIGALYALGYRREDFFLVRGQLDAPIEPVRWLGFPKPDPWTHFGGQFAVYISLGTLVFLVIGGRPSPAALLGALPVLPAVLLFAAMNAFAEEMTYRASLLATLEDPIGPRHALWLTAAFFGIGHFYGVPYGPIGVVLATFLGWMMGKAMLETRGFFWAWFIHFLQDVLIFAFMAVGSVTPGG